MLISRETADAVGDWDERFFLYSEETDYFRRARESGHTTWFEPEAIVRHAAGGSGSSVALEQLLAVNRVRYFAGYHGRVATFLFHVTAVLNHLVRSTDPTHRAVLRAVASPPTWAALPKASRARAVQSDTTNDLGGAAR